ncbi:MAG TPA: hypothetical protein PKC30_03585 [Saprospiraceae bacterium]|nr:hypothetical protein [Saprospiraceae bacterium]
MRKTLTNALFHLYDLRFNRDLSKKYNEVKHQYDQQILLNKIALNAFLESWGYENQLLNLPLMTKSDVIDKAKCINRKKVYNWAYTGGSFGEPLQIPYSFQRSLIRTATFRFYNEKAGYNLGDPYALIRAKEKPSILKFLRNEYIIIPLDTSTSNIRKMLQTMIERKIEFLLGYPTVMFDMAKEISLHSGFNDHLKIKNLVSTSEMIDEDKRNFIQKVFGCQLIDRYSNEEVGLIAQQKSFGSEYIVNQYGLFVEIVSLNNHMPVNSGEVGKVVVTDLNNDLIPIVRYDTGDLAVAGEYLDDQLFTIKSIIGRTADKLFDSKGNPVSSLALGPAIYKPLAKGEILTHYQFIQKSLNTFLLKLKYSKDIFSVDKGIEIIDNLKKLLGADVKINIEFVDNIEMLPSGKRSIYINEMETQPHSSNQNSNADTHTECEEKLK